MKNEKWKKKLDYCKGGPVPWGAGIWAAVWSVNVLKNGLIVFPSTIY